MRVTARAQAHPALSMLDSVRCEHRLSLNEAASLARLRFAPPLPFGRDRKALSLPKLGVHLISRAVGQHQNLAMIGQIGFQALKRSLIISATLVIAYLTGMVVAMYLLSFAFLGKTIAALGEVLLLPLFPGSYLGEVLLPQIDVFEQPKPAKLLLSIMLNIALYMVCIYPIVASSIELRTRK